MTIPSIKMEAELAIQEAARSWELYVHAYTAQEAAALAGTGDPRAAELAIATAKAAIATAMAGGGKAAALDR